MEFGIKIEGRIINNLRYADDTTLLAESESDMRQMLTRVKEESAKAGLQLNIKKTKIMASGQNDNWVLDEQEMEVVTDICRWKAVSYFYGFSRHSSAQQLILTSSIDYS